MSATTSGPPPGLKPLSVTPPLGRYLATMWGRRAFVVEMAAGEFRAKHANTFLGSLWYVLNPLLQLGVYWLVFGVILGVDRGVENFIGFLAAGIFVFQYSQRSITGGAGSISKNLSLIRSLQFPRALLPLSAVIREALTLRIALVVVAGILVVTGERVRLTWLVVVPLLLLQSVFNLGGAFVAARLADKVKDIENLLPFLFRLLFYGSGVIFLADRFIGDLPNPDAWRALFVANPLYSFVSLTRHYAMTSLEQEHVALMWLSVTSWSVLLLTLGLLFFRAGERTYGRG